MVATLFIMFYNPIINMLSTLFQKVIDYVLFPNLMLYLIIVIVANIVLIATILNNNLSRFIKGVNVILFSFMQVLLFFIIKYVISNNIDITTKLTMDYPQLLVLVETSIFIFALWCLFLLIIKLVDGIKDYREVKVMEVNYNLDLENDEDDFSNDELVEYVPIKKVQ
jgi:Ca2+/Na+ antiporter